MDRESQIKTLRGEGKTYREIGELLGVSKQRVWQICSAPKIKHCGKTAKRDYCDDKCRYRFNKTRFCACGKLISPLAKGCQKCRARGI